MKVSSAHCSVLSWNVWSIANEEKLLNFLQIIEDNQIDIACVTETWFDRKTGPFSRTIKSLGFKIHHAYREDKRGGGCAVIYKNNLSVKEGEASTTDFSSFEFSYATLSLKTGRKLIIICIYRKQEICFKLFYEEFMNFMDKRSNMNGTLLVVGDFNVWGEDTEDNDTTMLLDLMNAYGLVQSITEPTHRDGHTLDHAYFNPYQIECPYMIIDSAGFTSDHLPIVFQVPYCNVVDNTKTVFYRKLIKDIDMEGFREDLKKAVDNNQL